MADDLDGIHSWREVASTLDPDLLRAIVFGPPPPLRVRAWRSAVEWWNRPRGIAAVIAAQGEMMVSTIRLLQGEMEDAERAAERLWEEELRRRGGRRG